MGVQVGTLESDALVLAGDGAGPRVGGAIVDVAGGAPLAKRLLIASLKDPSKYPIESRKT